MKGFRTRTPVRATNHHGRIGTTGHNGRTFLSEDGKTADEAKIKQIKDKKDGRDKIEHIDLSRLRLNEYWFLGCDAKEYSGEDGPGSKTFMAGFEESELRFYKQKFGKSLKMQNERYKAQRHQGRIREMEDVLQTKNKSPVETILQIGAKGDRILEGDFSACVKEYVQRLQEWSKSHNDCYVLINYAIHHDEASPHAHLRGTFVWYDDDGVAHMGQDEALKRAGIELPDPDKKRGQYNNRKMAFDRMLREWWIEIAEAHGYVIEKEPIKGVEHLTVKGYKAKKDAEKEIAEKAAQLEAQKQEIQARAAELEAQRQALDNRADEVVAKERENRFKEVTLDDWAKEVVEDRDKLEAQKQALDERAVELDKREQALNDRDAELTAKKQNIEKETARLKEKETVLDKARKTVDGVLEKLKAHYQMYEKKIQELDKENHPLVAWAKRRKWKQNGKIMTIWELYQTEREKEKKVQQYIVEDPYQLSPPQAPELPDIQYPPQGPGLGYGE